MHKRSYNRLKYLIDVIEITKRNKEKVYTIPEEYEGSKVSSLTDREGFLEYILDHVQNELIDETVMHELEDEAHRGKSITLLKK